MPELTPKEKLMDYNGDNKVSAKEKKRFRQQAPQEVAAKWGIGYALITQLRDSGDPLAVGMADWFDGKVKQYINNPNAFSDQGFILEFDSQPWAQKYKSDAIKDMDFEARFPEIYKQEITKDIEDLRDQTIQFGVQLDDSELRELAVQRRRFGMSESQLRNALADTAAAKSGNFRGSAASLKSKLDQWSKRNGIPLSSSVVDDYVRKVMAGDTTEDDVFQEVRRMYLVGAYPGWAKQIEAGMDPYELARPYRSVMANLLELNEEQIGLDDPLLGQAMQSGMTLTDLRQQIRKDKRWQYTDNAAETYSEMTDELLDMFGFR